MTSSKFPGIGGKRVLITGATTGLGYAMAKALAAAGARIMVTGRDAARVDSAVRTLQPLSPDVLGTVLDVREEASVQRIFDRISRAWAGLDVLVNNAGIGMRTVKPRFLAEPLPFWEVPTAGFRNLFDTNVTGYFLTAKHAVPLLRAQRGGRIINISISLETMRRKGFVPYGPSRAATEAMSHIMAEDLKPAGITVNLLLPGGQTETGMTPDDVPADVRSRLLPPDIMAEPILFLCSDAAAELHDERIVAKDFAQWLAARQAH